jgi:hypothetical protein
MTDWRTAMRDAAHREEQDCLTGDQAEAMRRVVLAGVADATGGRARVLWMRRPVLVAAMIVAIVSIGLGTGIHLDRPNRSEQMSTSGQASEPPQLSAADAARAGTPNRQLQFLTPGGTRIIWVFNQDLDLKASLR